MEAQDSVKHAVADEVMSRAMKVGPRAALSEIRLVELTAKLSDVLVEQPTIGRTARSVGINRDDESNQVMVVVAFGLDLARDSDESKKDPEVKIEAKYGLIYRIDQLATVDDEHLAAFAELNGFFNAWPFFRELAHSILGRMGITPLTLPSLRVTTASSKEEGLRQ